MHISDANLRYVSETRHNESLTAEVSELRASENALRIAHDTARQSLDEQRAATLAVRVEELEQELAQERRERFRSQERRQSAYGRVNSDLDRLRTRFDNLQGEKDDLKQKVKSLQDELVDWERQYEHQYDEYPTAGHGPSASSASQIPTDEIDRQPPTRIGGRPPTILGGRPPTGENQPEEKISNYGDGAESLVGSAARAAGSKVKEADRITLPNWPAPTAFRKWRMTLVDETIYASALPTSAFKWLMELQTPTARYEQFASFNSPDGMRFETLDAKLASALMRIANNEFGKMIETKKFEAMSKGERVTGRQILFMLDRHFRMTTADGAVYDVEHLLNVALKNDNLAAFVATWDSVVARIEKTPEDSFLCSL